MGLNTLQPRCRAKKDPYNSCASWNMASHDVVSNKIRTIRVELGTQNLATKFAQSALNSGGADTTGGTTSSNQK